jgi:hypothetical protein
MAMNTSKLKKGIVIVVIVICLILATVVIVPALQTSALKVKYLSGGQLPMNPSLTDGISYGGEILIYIDLEPNESISMNGMKGFHGIYHADQYITFNGLALGKHTIDIWKGPLAGYHLLASKDATTEAIWTTTGDLHFGDGFM